jgi:hypothetical protein
MGYLLNVVPLSPDVQPTNFCHLLPPSVNEINRDPLKSLVWKISTDDDKLSWIQ